MYRDKFDYTIWDEEVKKFKKIKHRKTITEISHKDHEDHASKIVSNSTDYNDIELTAVSHTDFHHPKSSTTRYVVQEGFDKRILKDLRNNSKLIEGILDLHHFTREQARLKFFCFVEKAYERQKKYILVITGKGNLHHNEEKEDLLDQRLHRGVLYNSFFQWIEDPKMQKLIIRYSHADQIYGGSGAFYLLLRKKNI